MVSDTRRLSDVEWFRDVYGDAVQTVRVVASEETRKRRNWVFIAGERVSKRCFPEHGAEPGAALAPQPPHGHDPGRLRHHPLAVGAGGFK